MSTPPSQPETTAAPSTAGSSHKPKSSSVWLKRTAAILIGLSPFLVLEAILRIGDWPSVPPPADPFVDLNNLRPLFEADPVSGQMKISPERLNLFRPVSFAPRKPADTVRVFALGGSTTQGEPYSIETAFPQWMQLTLQAALPNQHVELINCGGLSYASYRVLAILREVLPYSPDVIVVYTGHNEYLEKRSYAGYAGESTLQRTRVWLSGLHIVQLARSLAGQAAAISRRNVSDPTQLQSEVDALLDYQGGLADYHRGDPWREPVVEHFQWNLKQMAAECRRAKVPLIFVRPVSNLRDCPPFKFEVDPRLSPSDRALFEQHWQAARAAPQSSPFEAPASGREQRLDHLQVALEIDSEHAGARYLLGQLQLDSGDFEAARNNLRRARDNDVCPLRATSAIAAAVAKVAHFQRVPLLDAEQLFAQRSDHNIIGDRWLVDHVHPNLEAHQLLGEELAQLCFELKWFPAPAAGWDLRHQDLFAEHLSRLGEDYFHRGQQRLAGLRLWTQGRAKKIRANHQMAR